MANFGGKEFRRGEEDDEDEEEEEVTDRV